jgi:alpha-tubulin suppressor-like RCC1 family protein
VQVEGLESGAKKLLVGPSAVCAIKDTGVVVCWGSNSMGQLGDLTKMHSVAPVTIPGLPSDIEALAFGFRGTLYALQSDGTVWGWSGSSDGLFPTDDGDVFRMTGEPVVVAGLPSDVNLITGHDVQTCVSSPTQGLWCWGENFYGALGIGMTTEWQKAAVRVPGF